MKVFKDLIITGEKSRVDALIASAASSMPGGWKFESHHEGFVNGTYSNFTRPAANGLRAAVVALFRKDKHEGTAEVVNILPSDGDALTHDEYNAILDDFAAFIGPLATAAGVSLTATAATAALEQWLTPAGASALRGFSNLANKSTGSAHPMDLQRWNAFIIQVHKDGSQFGVGDLGRYLVEELGWGNNEAHTLMLEYEFGLALLKQYSGR